MAWFTAAHMLFFVTQAMLYARLRQRQARAVDQPGTALNEPGAV
jgi:hypothetical protein